MKRSDRDGLDDQSGDGMAMVADICENYGFETEVLVASVRHPMHVLEAHPLTDSGLANILKDWETVPK